MKIFWRSLLIGGFIILLSFQQDSVTIPQTALQLYQIKNVVYKCFQWKQNTYSTRFLASFFLHSDVPEYQIWYQYIKLYRWHGMQLIDKDDYICKDIDGLTYYYKPLYFNKTFTPLDLHFP